MSKISAAQSQWIQGLICERLSLNDNNKELLFDFSNKNDNLVDYLQNRAWEEDNKNSIAHYIVKNNEAILFLFSLKCGELFEDVLWPDMALICEVHSGEKSITPEIKTIIHNYQVANGLSDAELLAFLDKQCCKWREQRKSAKQAINIAELPQIKVVLKTLSAIEITHFYKNDSCTAFNQNLFPQHKLGELIFWFHVLPRIQSILSYVGGEYIYLFAADNDENEPLINYYTNYLKFTRHTVYGANKSSYNCSCKFMCLDISQALSYQKELEDNFNDDDAEDDTI